MLRILHQIFRTGIVTEPLPSEVEERIEAVGKRLECVILSRFQRSLTIRMVDAGSCNGCELEIQAVNNPFYDCERFGIHFTASPRFADMLLVTGPVSINMEIALKRTYHATPPPKLVVAVGDCGYDGGIFGKSYASLGGVGEVLPVDVYIHGCPPSPWAILKGILKAVEPEGK
jgi:Ni,Fe-hydrogenase III small subunit